MVRVVMYSSLGESLESTNSIVPGTAQDQPTRALGSTGFNPGQVGVEEW